jgi:hypothetical protein
MSSVFPDRGRRQEFPQSRMAEDPPERIEVLEQRALQGDFDGLVGDHDRVGGVKQRVEKCSQFVLQSRKAKSEDGTTSFDIMGQNT